MICIRIDQVRCSWSLLLITMLTVSYVLCLWYDLVLGQRCGYLGWGIINMLMITYFTHTVLVSAETVINSLTRGVIYKGQSMIIWHSPAPLHLTTAARRERFTNPNTFQHWDVCSVTNSLLILWFACLSIPQKTGFNHVSHAELYCAPKASERQQCSTDITVSIIYSTDETSSIPENRLGSVLNQKIQFDQDMIHLYSQATAPDSNLALDL